jgi:hypothetical protein
VDDQVVLEVVEGLARVGAERVGRGEGQTGGKEEVRQVVRQNVSGVGRVLASWAAGCLASCLGVAATLLLPLPPPPFDLEESLCCWRSAPNPEK